MFKDWREIALICPDLKDGQDLKIKGSRGTMKASIAMMEVRRCNESRNVPGDPSCYDETAIDDFIEDLQIDTWIAYNIVDFSEHEKSPLSRVTENFGSFLAEKWHS